jgi:hypothetical protein
MMKGDYRLVLDLKADIVDYGGVDLILKPAALLSTSSNVIFYGFGLEHDFIALIEVSLEVLPNEFSLPLRPALVIEHSLYHLKVLLVIGLRGCGSRSEACVSLERRRLRVVSGLKSRVTRLCIRGCPLRCKVIQPLRLSLLID